MRLGPDPSSSYSCTYMEKIAMSTLSILWKTMML